MSDRVACTIVPSLSPSQRPSQNLAAYSREEEASSLNRYQKDPRPLDLSHAESWFAAPRLENPLRLLLPGGNSLLQNWPVAGSRGANQLGKALRRPPGPPKGLRRSNSPR